MKTSRWEVITSLQLEWSTRESYTWAATGMQGQAASPPNAPSTLSVAHLIRLDTLPCSAEPGNQPLEWPKITASTPTRLLDWDGGSAES